MSKHVLFGEAIQKAAGILTSTQLPAELGAPLLIRDIRGRVSIALNAPRSLHEAAVSLLQARMEELGAFRAEPGIICADDLFDAPAIFEDPSIVEFAAPGSPALVRLLDRQVTGHDWILDGNQPAQEARRPPRLVCFGVKGGVGRSTAIAILAYWLARKGKQVLVVDLDLESPGLSGLLLPPERAADFGVVDWLVEDAVGQGTAVRERLVAVSPLSADLRCDIRVVAAGGSGDAFYLDKLSRVYADVPADNRTVRFSARIQRLVEDLERREQPDVVLIDSRAGLHDLAAVSIVGLASTAFLFANDTPQCWQAYRSLFLHWRARPQVARRVRERLKMVSALFPETDQIERAHGFLERSHQLYTDTIYDETEATPEPDFTLFNFDLEDNAAPHFPFRIKWNNRFQEFYPLLISRGIVGVDDLRASFGDFLDGAAELVESGGE